MNFHLYYNRGVYAISIFLWVLTIPIYATTYYVDFANGNDNNNGLTSTTAFKHAPGDPMATGSADGTTLQAGDIVQFKSGVDYKGQVLLSRNGTSENFIEYRGQGWGTGRSTFNMEYNREYAFKGGADYIKISGFNFYYYPDTGTDYVIYPTSGANYWVVDSVTIAYIKDWNDLSLFPDKACILLTNSTSNITIQNSEFFANGRTTMRLRYVSYITLKHNNFGGINRGSETGWFSVAIRGEVTCNNIHIEDNVFHDGWQYGGDQVPELNHAPAFIHIYGDDATTHPDQIYIERNYFYNDKVFSTGTGTGSLEITTQVQNVYIRNNIFANACQYWGTQLLLSSGCNNIQIYNNTFIDRAYETGYGVNSIKVYLNSGIVGNNIDIKNNIFWSDANSSGDDCVNFHGNGTFQGTIDHNIYYRSNSNHVNVFNDGVVSWSTWQGHGLDANSHFHSITEPAFVYMPPSGATTSSGDYSIDPAATNLIDKGVTLTGFSDSYNGVSRPQGNAWDIGAYEYSGTNNDITSPEVTGASITNVTTVIVNFSEALDQVSSENISNYSIDNGITVNSAILSADNTHVTLTTNAHNFNQQYTVTVNNVKDLAGNIINPQANSAAYLLPGDTTPPEITSAYLTDATTLVVNFSEALEQTGAENTSNYIINNGITVSEAVLSNDGTKVTLTTSPHANGENYLLTVNNIEDLAGNVISAEADTAGYSFFNDSIPPDVIGASLSGTKMVNVVFSERMDQASAEDINNYSISGGISINSATILCGDTIVTLRTSQHSSDVIYTLTVNNVKDIAGNIISPNFDTAEYQKVNGGGGKHKVNANHAVAHWYQDFEPNRSIDGNYDTTSTSRWAGILAMPDSIVFDLNEICYISESQLSFFRWSYGRIYQYSIQISIDDIHWTEILSNLISSSSEWTVNDFDPVQARYIKLIALSSNESDYAGLWEAQFFSPDQTTETNITPVMPTDFKLEQNYPNPFNPTTKINFSLPSDQHVTIDIYNVIGEQVKELVNQDYAAGSYSTEFNAADLPSGIYIYRLQTKSFTDIKKMVLLK